MRKETQRHSGEAEVTEEERIANSMVVVFDARLWGVVANALEDKNGETLFSEDDEASMTNFFKDVCPGFIVENATTASDRERGEVRTRLTVPESWRRVYRKKHRDVENDRVLYDMFYDFANAAVNLYGAVSAGDLAEIADHWWNDARWLRWGCPDDATSEDRKESCRIAAETAMEFVKARQTSPFAVAYARESDGLAVSFSKYPPKKYGEPMPDALANTLKLRKGKERWYPETFDDFIAWGVEEERDWPDEYDDLEQFILDTWNFDLDEEDDQNDFDNAMEEAHDALASGRMWNGAVDAMRTYIDFSTLSEDDFAELATILCKCANATRQDANWAFTPNELMKMNGLGGTFDMQSVHTGFASDPNAPIVRASAKVGRNDPCPCGSGRKFKKCCMADWMR